MITRNQEERGATASGPLEVFVGATAAEHLQCVGGPNSRRGADENRNLAEVTLVYLRMQKLGRHRNMIS